jgi:hypothetical protein
MTELVSGQFYWVQPTFDPDEDNETLIGVQPALYAGTCVSGEDTGYALAWTSHRRGLCAGGRRNRPAEGILRRGRRETAHPALTQQLDFYTT